MTWEDSVLYLGIDVGTGSTRIGAFMAGGTMVGTSSRPIRTMQPRAGYSQQSTTDIWSAVSGASSVSVVGASAKQEGALLRAQMEKENEANLLGSVPEIEAES